MAWTYAQLASAFGALSPAPASLVGGAQALNAQTTVAAQDTSGTSVRGVLYARAPSGKPSSFERALSVAEGITPAAGITPASGYTAAQVVALCQALVGIMTSDAPVPMSQSSISAKVQSDLTVLMASKLSDGKGILWAAGDLAPGDPGDSAVLMATLVNISGPTWSPPVAVYDLQACQKAGLISSTVAVS